MSPRPREDPRNEMFALRLENALLKSGLSQAALARKLKISAGAVGHWVRNRVRPARKRLRPLSEALCVEDDYLEGGGMSEVDEQIQRVLVERVRAAPRDLAPELMELFDRFESLEALAAFLRTYHPTRSE